ncbi:hypothetical protein JW968_07480 [Candidatus Woesearchaeota archaeon]|nr:hypothetical protein [Candidatus Woesearchaeota archaeon]
MIREVKSDIISVMKDVLAAIKEDDPAKVKELSNHTIHNASIYGDKDSLSIAILIYAVSKIMERGAGNISGITVKISKLILDLQKDNLKGFSYNLKHILRSIAKHDVRLGLYIEEVINQANIKKGSKLFEHGFSIGKASEMLGITQWELLNYIGKTKLPEEMIGPMNARQRLKLARSIFGV